jgi:hypothetical protein
MKRKLHFIKRNGRLNNEEEIISYFEKVIIREKPDIFFWEYLDEYNILGINHEITLLKVNEILKNCGATLFIVFASENQDYYNKINNLSNINIIFVPLSLLFLFHYNHQNVTKMLRNEIKNQNFDNLFINLNHRSHYHRCLLMDEMAKRNLLQYGNYSWIIPNYEFNFEYWKQKKVTYDSFPFTNCEDVHFTMNYENPLVNIVTETTTDLFYMSEKTFKPILINQIFLLLGSKNQNINLKKYGFELYDEIFDYDFDSKIDIKDRIDGLLDNIDRIKNQNYNLIYKELKPKIKRNYENALDIIENNKFIPEIYYEIIDENKETYYNLYQNYENPLLLGKISRCYDDKIINRQEFVIDDDIKI